MLIRKTVHFYILSGLPNGAPTLIFGKDSLRVSFPYQNLVSGDFLEVPWDSAIALLIVQALGSVPIPEIPGVGSSIASHAAEVALYSAAQNYLRYIEQSLC